MDLYNKLSLLSVPSGYKINRSFNIKPFNNTEDFDFTRSTTATRVNSKGIIEVIAVDILRLDYAESLSSPSLLLERSSTNLITYSEDFSQWSITSGTMSRESGYLSPDGTNNAYKINGPTSSRIQLPTSGLTVGEQYTFSIYLKADAAMDIGIGGIVTATPDVSITTEWKRYEVTQIASSTTRFPQVQYTGDLGNVYIWGAQLEQQTYATSYIPTDGASATRNQELCVDATPVINSEEGTLYAEISALAIYNLQRWLGLSDGTNNNKVIIAFYNNSTDYIIACEVKSGGSTQAFMTYNFGAVEPTFVKVAIKYKENDFALWVNGTEVATDTSGSAPIGLSELAFDRGDGAQNFFGNTKGLKYYPKALADVQLEDLTTI